MSLDAEADGKCSPEPGKPQTDAGAKRSGSSQARDTPGRGARSRRDPGAPGKLQRPSPAASSGSGAPVAALPAAPGAFPPRYRRTRRQEPGDGAGAQSTADAAWRPNQRRWRAAPPTTRAHSAPPDTVLSRTGLAAPAHSETARPGLGGNGRTDGADPVVVLGWEVRGLESASRDRGQERESLGRRPRRAVPGCPAPRPARTPFPSGPCGRLRCPPERRGPFVSPRVRPRARPRPGPRGARLPAADGAEGGADPRGGGGEDAGGGRARASAGLRGWSGRARGPVTVGDRVTV
uniref:proline-rich protein 2-like n=1 Tax=Odobenus rosmarus divergens TaxID=9708 RepID=UPI00063C6EC4|nr:PREDICTED: proline-rich protein 2-like [Odobenus rosmarus divergens]